MEHPQHEPGDAGRFSDEKELDQATLTPESIRELQACRFRTIAPGQRTITRHIFSTDEVHDSKPLTVFELTSELEGNHFIIGYAYRSGDARMFAACRNLFGIAVWIVERYKGVHLETIGDESIRELVRRARAAALSVEEMRIAECGDTHKEGG
jgi:hypothetical protein